MNKTLSALLLLFAVGFAASCDLLNPPCTTAVRYYLRSVGVKPYRLQKEPNGQQRVLYTDTLFLEETLRFEITPTVEFVAAQRPSLWQLGSLGMLSLANACPPPTLTNPIDPNKCAFSVNTPITYYNGGAQSVIAAHENLLTHPALRPFINFDDQLTYERVSKVAVSPDANIFWQAGNYTFSFSWETANGDRLTATQKVVIR